MFYKLAVYISLITLFSCADYEENFFIEEEIEVYYLDFFNEAEIRGVYFEQSDLVIVLGNLPVALGTTIRGNQSPRIIIDSDFWAKARTEKKRFVVYHELGHALLNKRDNKDITSLMCTGEAEAISNFYLNKSEMLDKLFTK